MKKHISIILIAVILSTILASCMSKGTTQTIESSSKESTVSVSQGKEESTTETTQVPTTEITELTTTEIAESETTTAKSTTKHTTTKKPTTTKASTTKRVTTTQKHTTTKKPTTTKKKTTTKKPTTTKVTTTKHKHGAPCGNMGKWYSSRSELKDDYMRVSNYWLTKYDNGEIDWDTYVKNCPCGYECWSCGECGMWTGNYKY